MTSPKTAQAMAELRLGAMPALDPEAFAMVKKDVLAMYGWAWPDGVDLVEGSKQLFMWLIEKQENRNLMRGRL